MKITTNISNLITHKDRYVTEFRLQNTRERLSSGLRINRGADDPSGLALSDSMTARLRGLEVTKDNLQDGISLFQTLDGSLAEINEILIRMRDLSVRAANEATLSGADRSRLNDEYHSLVEEINKLTSSSSYNGKNYLEGLTFDLVSSVNDEWRTSDAFAAGWNTAGFDASGWNTPKEGNSVLNGQPNLLPGFEDSVAQWIWDPSDNNTVYLRREFEISQSVFDKIDQLSVTITADDGYDLYINGNLVGADFGSWAVPETYDITAQLQPGQNVLAIEAANAGATRHGVAVEYDYQVGSEQDLQVGPDSTAEDRIVLSLPEITPYSLGVASANLTMTESAQQAIDRLDSAIQTISNVRADMGINQKRLESTLDDVSSQVINVAAARSTIQDADMARQAAEMTRAQIMQSSTLQITGYSAHAPERILELMDYSWK